MNIIIFLGTPKALPKERWRIVGIPKSHASPQIPDTSVRVCLRQKMCDSNCTLLTSILAELHSDTVTYVILALCARVTLTVYTSSLKVNAVKYDIRQCHESGSLSLACHTRGPCSIPDQYTWDLWRNE